MMSHMSYNKLSSLTLLLPGDPSNFVAFVDPLNVKYIEVFYADFSYLSIY